MVNGPTTPIPVKAKPSSIDPVVPHVGMGKEEAILFPHNTAFSFFFYLSIEAIPNHSNGLH